MGRVCSGMSSRIQVWKSVGKVLSWGYPELQPTLFLPAPVQHVSSGVPQPCSSESIGGLCPSALLWWLSPGAHSSRGSRERACAVKA